MFNNKQLSKVQFYKYFNKTFNTWHCEVHASRRCPHVTEVDLCAEKRLTSIYVYVKFRESQSLQWENEFLCNPVPV